MSEVNSTAPGDTDKPTAAKPIKPARPRDNFPLGFQPTG
jgi:hypothetical protein